MGNPIGKFNLKPNPVENFSDLYTDVGLKALDKFLASKSYISRCTPPCSKSRRFFCQCEQVVRHPSSQLASTLPGKAARVRVSSSKAEAATPTLAAAVAGCNDVDDLDLFGDETEVGQV
ncbi:hypothetical protein C1H46_005169 [Malus baccata]|uniref:Uncharacterized protein n=1 Tax=Malus baccata TaxID=106549 RepID=A0A540NDW3_MALBA|nr:hypothetical protein C1H46_005169 [Malus baccata]